MLFLLSLPPKRSPPLKSFEQNQILPGIYSQNFTVRESNLSYFHKKKKINNLLWFTLSRTVHRTVGKKIHAIHLVPRTRLRKTCMCARGSGYGLVHVSRGFLERWTLTLKQSGNRLWALTTIFSTATVPNWRIFMWVCFSVAFFIA